MHDKIPLIFRCACRGHLSISFFCQTLKVFFHFLHLVGLTKSLSSLSASATPVTQVLVPHCVRGVNSFGCFDLSGRKSPTMFVLR